MKKLQHVPFLPHALHNIDSQVRGICWILARNYCSVNTTNNTSLRSLKQVFIGIIINCTVFRANLQHELVALCSSGLQNFGPLRVIFTCPYVLVRGILGTSAINKYCPLRSWGSEVKTWMNFTCNAVLKRGFCNCCISHNDGECRTFSCYVFSLNKLCYRVFFLFQLY